MGYQDMKSMDLTEKIKKDGKTDNEITGVFKISWILKNYGKEENIFLSRSFFQKEIWKSVLNGLLFPKAEGADRKREGENGVFF